MDDQLDEKLLIRSDARQRLSSECLQEHIHCDLGRIGYRYCKCLGCDVSGFILKLENRCLRSELIGNRGPGDQSCLLIDGHSCRCVVQDIPQSLALFGMVQVETERGPNIGTVGQIAQGDGRGSKGVVLKGQCWRGSRSRSVEGLYGNDRIGTASKRSDLVGRDARCGACGNRRADDLVADLQLDICPGGRSSNRELQVTGVGHIVRVTYACIACCHEVDR